MPTRTLGSMPSRSARVIASNIIVAPAVSTALGTSPSSLCTSMTISPGANVRASATNEAAALVESFSFSNLYSSAEFQAATRVASSAIISANDAAISATLVASFANEDAISATAAATMLAVAMEGDDCEAAVAVAGSDCEAAPTPLATDLSDIGDVRLELI